MADDAEKPITRPNGEPQESAQFDDHGQRQEPQENGNAEINKLIRQQEASREYRIQEFKKENPGINEWNDEFIDAWDRYFHTHFKKKDIKLSISEVESCFA